MLTALWNGKPRNAHRFGRHLLRRNHNKPELQKQTMFEYNPLGVHSLTKDRAPWVDGRGLLYAEDEIAEKYFYIGELVLDETEGTIHYPTLMKAAKIAGDVSTQHIEEPEIRVAVSNMSLMLYHSIMNLAGTRDFKVSADEVLNMRRG